jgi:hypothetical protein
LQPDGGVLVGGSFMSLSGMTFPRLARITAQGLRDSTFNPGTGPNGVVQALALTASGQVLTGGAFTSYDGRPGQRVVRLYSDGRLDTRFDPGAGPNNDVLALAAQPDGKVWIGGAFTEVDGTPSPYLARLRADGRLDSGLELGRGPNGPVRWLAWRSDGRLFMGGDFTEFDGYARVGVALLNTEPRLFAPTWQDGALWLQVPTLPGRSYILEFKATLDQAEWTWLQTQVGEGAVFTFPIASPASPQGFYRVRME